MAAKSSGRGPSKPKTTSSKSTSATPKDPMKGGKPANTPGAQKITAPTPAAEKKTQQIKSQRVITGPQPFRRPSDKINRRSK